VSLIDVAVVIIMAAILFGYLRAHQGEVEFVRSSIDGRTYLVRKLPDRKAAADNLARQNANLLRLVRHMMAKYGKSNADVRRLYANFDPNNVSEGGLEVGYTSYSLNKGEKLVLCIRQKDNSFVSDNVMVYVAVHELGHLMTEDLGHPKAFWDNFEFLLREAVKIGMYDVVDFEKNPQDYCGIRITKSII